ncbi:MAG: hypothetical protein ACP5JG_18770, partial [Anaerolineae bacterium]
AVLLVWIYYSAQILLLGAEFTQVYARRYGSRLEAKDGAVQVAKKACEVPEVPEGHAKPSVPHERIAEVAMITRKRSGAPEVGTGDGETVTEELAGPLRSRSLQPKATSPGAAVGIFGAILGVMLALGYLLSHRDRE